MPLPWVTATQVVPGPGEPGGEAAAEATGVGVVHGDERVVVGRSGDGDEPAGHRGVPAGRRAGQAGVRRRPALPSAGEVEEGEVAGVGVAAHQQGVAVAVDRHARGGRGPGDRPRGEVQHLGTPVRAAHGDAGAGSEGGLAVVGVGEGAFAAVVGVPAAEGRGGALVRAVDLDGGDGDRAPALARRGVVVGRHQRLVGDQRVPVVGSRAVRVGRRRCGRRRPPPCRLPSSPGSAASGGA